MKQVLVVGALLMGMAPAIFAQAPAAGTSLGTVRLTRAVTADGKPLPAGSYQIRLTNDSPKPGVGQSPDAERYVEFVQGGKVIAREVATVVSAADIGTVAKGSKPAAGSSKVELLKGDEYVRVWINRGGNNYILHLPAAKS
jgi:hypothetical protein